MHGKSFQHKLCVPVYMHHAVMLSGQPRQREFSMICKWANMKLNKREERRENDFFTTVSLCIFRVANNFVNSQLL